ncbi:hypothetical protein [Blautia liquoris]|nr:hypothetical protein [Blautia liquoris]
MLIRMPQTGGNIMPMAMQTSMLGIAMMIDLRQYSPINAKAAKNGDDGV